MTFVLTGADTNGELLQIDCTSPSTGVKEPEHVHPFQESRFELLSGTLMVSIAGEERPVRAGEAVTIPPNVPHYFWNGGDAEAHYIQEFRPALHSDQFFETLFGLAQAGKLNERGTTSLLEMAVVIPRFWNEIRVTKPPQIVQRLTFAVLGPVGRLLGYRGV
jgi:mannose-6-phosphate isomerase-like protein (cupin superfamily)